MRQHWELIDAQRGVVITYTSRGSARKAAERWHRFLGAWLCDEETE